jgi:hypothetical protein
MNYKSRLHRIESKLGAKDTRIVIASYTGESVSEARKRLNLPKATRIVMFYNVLPK